MTIRATANQVAGKAGLLSEETKSTIDHWRGKFPEGQHGRRSAIVQALAAAQEQNSGWVSDELMDAVADYLDVPPVWVYEVATFYGAIETEPVGRHSVSICTNISCMLCGADEDRNSVVQGNVTGVQTCALPIFGHCPGAGCCPGTEQRLGQR